MFSQLSSGMHQWHSIRSAHDISANVWRHYSAHKEARELDARSLSRREGMFNTSWCTPDSWLPAFLLSVAQRALTFIYMLKWVQMHLYGFLGKRGKPIIICMEYRHVSILEALFRHTVSTPNNLSMKLWSVAEGDVEGLHLCLLSAAEATVQGQKEDNRTYGAEGRVDLRCSLRTASHSLLDHRKGRDSSRSPSWETLPADIAVCHALIPSSSTWLKLHHRLRPSYQDCEAFLSCICRQERHFLTSK